MATTVEVPFRPHFLPSGSREYAMSEGCSQRTAKAEPCKEEMVLAHLPQVRLVARSLWERTRFAVELDDLIGYGMLGLLDAVRKFDPSRGVMLKTYAEHRIRGAIRDGLRGMDWLSRSARRQAKSRSEERDSAKNHATTSPRAAGLGVCYPTGKTEEAKPEAHRETTRQPPPKLTSLFCGGGVGEIERLYLNSRPPAEWSRHQPTPERMLERKQERTALAGAMETLPERQRQVLDLYYRKEYSMKQIAGLMGVHESRVSQIHLAAITRLRKALNSKATLPAIRMQFPDPPADRADYAEAIAG